MRIFFKMSLLSFLIVSCTKETAILENLPTNASPNIELQYQSYVDIFFEEAAMRKVDVNDTRLQVITGFPRPEYCGLGYSNYLGNGSMRVEISPEPSCWSNRNETEREILMFHELGHAVLGRSHKEGNYASSNPVSIMCSETCNGLFQLYNNFTPQLRAHYLDELFDPMTDPPSWASKSKSTTIFEDNMDDPQEDWTFVAARDSLQSFSYSLKDTLAFDNTALSITASGRSTENAFSFWRRTLSNPPFPEGSGLKLSVEITTDNLIGEGVAVALRTDSKDGEETILTGFQTTQGIISLNGSLKNKTVTVQLGYFPNEVENVHLFLLMLNGSEGKTYFDNVKLELLE